MKWQAGRAVRRRLDVGDDLAGLDPGHHVPLRDALVPAEASAPYKIIRPSTKPEYDSATKITTQIGYYY